MFGSPLNYFYKYDNLRTSLFLDSLYQIQLCISNFGFIQSQNKLTGLTKISFVVNALLADLFFDNGKSINYFDYQFYDSVKGYVILSFTCFKPQLLTDTGKDSRLVHRRKRPKVNTLFSSFFPMRPSDEYDSAPS